MLLPLTYVSRHVIDGDADGDVTVTAGKVPSPVTMFDINLSRSQQSQTQLIEANQTLLCHSQSAWLGICNHIKLKSILASLLLTLQCYYVILVTFTCA